MTTPQGPQPQDIPPFDASKPHHARPHLRPTVQGQPVGVKNPQGQQQVMLALGDRAQIAERSVVTSPLAQFMLGQMNGERDVRAIADAAAKQASQANVPQEAIPHINEDNVKLLVAQLDNAGLLMGPTFNEILHKFREQFDDSDTLPPASTASTADVLVQQEIGEEATDDQKKELGPEKLREAMEKWIDEALKPVEDPSLDTLPRAVIVPQLDYFRGWMNYAHVYGRLRVVDRPDRVVILGANNFGFGTGVVGCNKSYETPLGRCDYDKDFADRLCARLGPENTEKLWKDRYDHEREHSIEVQLPWIQHVFGDAEKGDCPPVFGVLVHDPSRNNGESYDGKGLGILPFIDALKGAIADAPGKTLVICSANLSHMGRSFGDQTPFAGDSAEANAARNKVLQHDREMIQLVSDGKAEELVSSLAWQQNPTRWNSTGAIVATMKALDAKKVRLLNFAAAGDNQSFAFISSMAAIIE
ncbi:MAG: AmmeMemoRadiSam system protein B [Phycisphaeraceae bacterium]|nr:MAG: AmmeMemoRadiSam system protein B [Phycisphaeraceae bacterium]